ncbi:MAG: hypothetical protein UV67_C0003G0002 [Parcubacteria group bacterium GW2011_GWC1_43_12]|nr:MAG: hypothetical protein UV34_C0040G0003 [Parcubacteria group bacterium GW2011_GWB1_42_6]KKS92450.1 MAG: hypothetical protein UV67_C0003G0002 [Parcubacteria group bacterium GW2011_GWC1_43_12]
MARVKSRIVIIQREKERKAWEKRNPGKEARYFGGFLYVIKDGFPDEKIEGAKKIPKPGKNAIGKQKGERSKVPSLVIFDDLPRRMEKSSSVYKSCPRCDSRRMFLQRVNTKDRGKIGVWTCSDCDQLMRE